MNKTEAKKQAVNNARTIGDLRKLIASKRGGDGFSKVNSAIPLDRALDIFEAAIAGRDEAEIPKGLRYDVYKRRDVPSKDSMIVANILRECA